MHHSLAKSKNLDFPSLPRPVLDDFRNFPKSRKIKTLGFILSSGWFIYFVSWFYISSRVVHTFAKQYEKQKQNLQKVHHSQAKSKHLDFLIDDDDDDDDNDNEWWRWWWWWWIMNDDNEWLENIHVYMDDV